MGELRLFFKIKHDVQNDSEIPLARAELESILGEGVTEVVNPVDLMAGGGPLGPLLTPGPPRLQDWITRHAYPGRVQGFYAEVGWRRDLSDLLRLSYFREIYAAASSDEIPPGSVGGLMPGILARPDPSGPREQDLAPFARIFLLDGLWVLRIVPFQAMYEFSDFVIRLANSPRDVERMFEAGIEHLRRGIYRPYSAESSRLFKTIEDFMDDRRAPQLYLTHWFFGIHGKFFPRMIRAAMNAVGLREGDLVLDPFAGCGTLNVEASLMGIRSVGVEVNPLLAEVSRVKVRALSMDPEEVGRAVREMESALSGSDWLSLELAAELGARLPEKLRSRVRPDSLAAVASILEAAEGAGDPDLRALLRVPLMYWMRSMLTKQDPDRVRRTYLDHLRRMHHALLFLELFRDRVAPLEPAPAKVLVGDSTDLAGALGAGAAGELREGFDAAVTSPPYMTAIDYVGEQLYALYVLGFTRDHLEIDRRTLGSKRAVDDAPGPEEAGLPESVVRLVGEIASSRRRHASALLKYFSGILRSMEGLARVMKPGGHVVWVIGRRQVMRIGGRRVEVPVAELMTELGWRAGLRRVGTVHVELAKSSERGAIPTESLIFFEVP